MATEKTLTYEERKQVLVNEAWARFPDMKKDVYFYRPWSPALKVTSCQGESEVYKDPFDYEANIDTLYYHGTAIYCKGEWGEMLLEDLIGIISSPLQDLLKKYKDNIDVLKYMKNLIQELPYMVERHIENNERAADTGQED